MLRHLLRRSLRPYRRRLYTSGGSSATSEPRSSPIPDKQPLSVSSSSSSTSPAILHRRRSSLPLFLALSGTAASTVALTALISHLPDDNSPRLPPDLEQTLERSKNSVKRVFDRLIHTGAAAAVLWRSLVSVLSSANQEVRSGFEFRVAALLADIAAASGDRRAAIVGAGGGAVVDWLLESVASGGERSGTQAEAARALAHLVADPRVCGDVLGRPHAVPLLLRFIFSFQPKKKKKQFKHSSLDSPGLCKGRSMLVAALMEIVTSNCDHHSSFLPLLPGNANMRDVATVLEVIEEGGLHFDDLHGRDDSDDGDRGLRGIGIKILGGKTVLGLSRTNGVENLGHSVGDFFESAGFMCRPMAMANNSSNSLRLEGVTSVTVPGLWDDLQREHVAVPFATWALANWALASELNRSHIQELDKDGHAVMTALTAPERTVKWHGSLVARALLSDQNLPLTDSVPDWSSSLLSTAFHAIKVDDISLTQVALSAFLVSIERSNDAMAVVMEKGLHLMREIARKAEKDKYLQGSLTRVLELLYKEGMHLPLEESQKWSSILLRWIFGKCSSETARSSATKILSSILEDYGPALIPISQGWLTLMLIEILGASKASNVKGNTPAMADKVKTQIDVSNALSASQVANQLASAVVRLAVLDSESEPDSVDKFPLADFLSLEPFAAVAKSINKNKTPKFHAADSALATLKGIKALAELCSEDDTCKNRIADFGVLCLLRRFLLDDDYEKLAAFETYDASRVLEMQDQAPPDSGDSSTSNSNDPSGVPIPPTAHIRRHAARLLTILSFLPNVKKAIKADEGFCKWLDDCASGKISCCNDLKSRSYARAILLNLSCSDQIATDAVTYKYADAEKSNQKIKCPQYADMILLLNPESPHWRCSDKNDLDIQKDFSSAKDPVSPDYPSPENENESTDNEGSNAFSSVNGSNIGDETAAPLLDVIFVHGIRGGPFKSWRMADNKSSTTRKAGLVEKIDQEAGKEGTFWPSDMLAADLPDARLFTLKYKTNLSQWSGASLPLQEVSSMLLQKLIAAGIGDRPVVFVAHSMGGLVVKQMLYQAKMGNYDKLVSNTIGVVFYSCPHFGSKLADVPWRMGLVFRPAPSIGELRSGSPRLLELNDFVRHLHNKGLLDVLSFSETQVTPIVEGYGGWAFRLEIVPIESAYPGFGELVVLEATDHINSCKPVNRNDPSYAETLKFLQKLKARLT